MAQHDEIPTLSYILIGATIGAAFMYFMDPAQGRRRRALVRDKAYSASVQTRNAFDASTHDLSKRAQALSIKASRVLH